MLEIAKKNDASVMADFMV